MIFQCLDSCFVVFKRRIDPVASGCNRVTLSIPQTDSTGYMIYKTMLIEISIDK